jgi:septal ring factor EnvC (AmiA/AmiB activator)
MNQLRTEISELEAQLAEHAEVMHNLKNQLTPIDTAPLKEKVAEAKKRAIASKPRLLPVWQLRQRLLCVGCVS